jgi:hypothetical protein
MEESSAFSSDNPQSAIGNRTWVGSLCHEWKKDGGVMKRLLGLAVLGLVLYAADVHATGCCGGWGPGYFDIGTNLYGQWGPGAPPGAFGGAPAPTPTVLGPWYNYWPLEAHFQVPAHPQYPYWGPPQTLPNGAPAAGNAPPSWHLPSYRAW